MQYQLSDNWLEIACSSLFYPNIQEFLNALVPSRKYQHLLLQNKWLLLDRQPVQRDTVINGDTLQLLLYPENYFYRVKTAIKAQIIYEDELFLLLRKPADILVQSDGQGGLCLNDLVESYFARYHLYGRVVPLHNLDYPTQGLILYVKSPIFQPLLDKQLADRLIKREYLAFVFGLYPQGKKETIEKKIGGDRHDAKKRRITPNGQAAKTVITGLYAHPAYSVIRCELKTGRTHQIRLHLASIDYPLLNDPLYGHPSALCQGLGLVADKITFYHPLKEEVLTFTAPLSKDLQKLYH